MTASRLVPFAGAFTLGLAGLLIAAPAVAAPASLPGGQRITTVESTQPDQFEAQLYDTSPADATSTPVGSPSDVGVGAIQAIDVNDDGIGYAIGHFSDPQHVTRPMLFKADANTGVLSDPIEIFVFNAEFLERCTGLDLLPTGEIIVACMILVNTKFILIGVVDPVTGQMIPDVSVGGNGTPDISALAYNAVNSTLYAVIDGDGQSIVTVDRANHALIDPVPVTGPFIESADFDRDGQLFLTLNAGDTWQLGTIDPAVGLVDVVGDLTTGGEPLDDTAALTVWGKAPLAATGSADLAPLGVGTLLLLAGAALLAAGRMRRRAA